MSDTATPPSDGSVEKIDRVSKMPLTVSIEIGRTRMTIDEILTLGRGSVVRLDRRAGEAVDLYVNDKRFAEGEVVVVGDHFGFRVTRVVEGDPTT